MSEIFPLDDFDSFSWQSVGKYISVFVVKKVDSFSLFLNHEIV